MIPYTGPTASPYESLLNMAENAEKRAKDFNLRAFQACKDTADYLKQGEQAALRAIEYREAAKRLQQRENEL